MIVGEGKIQGLIPLRGSNQEVWQKNKELRPWILAGYKLEMRPKHVAIPGLFDMHFHWVQDDVTKMPKDNLLRWLEKYTWPAEAKFSSQGYALKKANKFAQKLLRAGTLGGAIYDSIHDHTVDLSLKKFHGNFISGNVLMTMQSPSYLQQNSKDAVAIVKHLAEKYKQFYAVTPRFAPTVDPKTMAQCSKIGIKNNCFFQTHACETKEEVQYVLDLYKSIAGFEKVKSYTEIYDKVGMLGERTILGHGIYLSSDDLKRIKKSRSIIAHCPTSNAPKKQHGLGSGLFDLKQAFKHKMRWVLASDIGGGPFLSMLDVMQSFVDQQKRTGIASYSMAFYRSTLAGASCLNIGEKTGSLLPGMDANFSFIPMDSIHFKSRGKYVIKSHSKGEEVLRNVLQPLAKHREYYDDVVDETVYLGITLYKRG